MIELSGLSSERREDVGVCDDWLSSLGWAGLLVEGLAWPDFDVEEVFFELLEFGSSL